MSKTIIYEWHRRFQNGRKDVEDDERPGRPSTTQTDANVKKVKEIIINDNQKAADHIGIAIGSCHEIVSKVLGVKRVAAKFVPKLLNFEQKQRRIKVAQESLNDAKNDAELVKRVITSDET